MRSHKICLYIYRQEETVLDRTDSMVSIFESGTFSDIDDEWILLFGSLGGSSASVMGVTFNGFSLILL